MYTPTYTYQSVYVSMYICAYVSLFIAVHKSLMGWTHEPVAGNIEMA